MGFTSECLLDRFHFWEMKQTLWWTFWSVLMTHSHSVWGERFDLSLNCARWSQQPVLRATIGCRWQPRLFYRDRRAVCLGFLSSSKTLAGRLALGGLKWPLCVFRREDHRLASLNFCAKFLGTSAPPRCHGKLFSFSFSSPCFLFLYSFFLSFYNFFLF